MVNWIMTARIGTRLNHEVPKDSRHYVVVLVLAVFWRTDHTAWKNVGDNLLDQHSRGARVRLSEEMVG